MFGSLAGLALAAVASVTVLAAHGGFAQLSLASLAAVAMLGRSRLFPAVAARLPLLAGGALGLAIVAALRLPTAGAALRLVGTGLADVVVITLLAAATMTGRRRSVPSPYLGRILDIVDLSAVILLAPVACAVLGLYGLVRDLTG
jgi:hypothetical protein